MLPEGKCRYIDGQIYPDGNFFVLDTQHIKHNGSELKSALNGISTDISNKVDKETGKGLSTNDYTTAEKNKLSGIEANANNYVHPSAAGNTGSFGDSSNQTPSYGGTFKVPYITVNSDGHVTAISEHTVKIPASDNTNTHRPIKVNGSQILGDNTTALNLYAGSNVKLTNSSGTVTIDALLFDNSQVYSGQNLDTISETCFRVYNSPSNMPSGESGYCYVRTTYFDINSAMQELFMFTTGVSYVRVRYNSSSIWQSWRKITN